MFTVSNSSDCLLVTSCKMRLILCPSSSNMCCTVVSKTRRVTALYSGKQRLRFDLCCGCTGTFTSYCLDSDCLPCDLTLEEYTNTHTHRHTHTWLVCVISNWWPMGEPPVSTNQFRVFHWSGNMGWHEIVISTTYKSTFNVSLHIF